MHPLDRLVWTALTTRQAQFSEGGPLARRMRESVGPFAAAEDNASPTAVAALAALIPQGGDIALLEPAPPEAPAGATCALARAGVQMVLGDLRRPGAAAAPVQALDEEDSGEMLALAQATRPGPFRAETHRLGRFLGVREAGRLIAMAGERLRIDGFVEVSAVCTDVDHRGRGLGATLLAQVAQRILDEGETPFLHSYADNETAIAMYRKLGFEVRCGVTHAIWRRAAPAGP